MLDVEETNECRWSQTVKNERTGAKNVIDLEERKGKSKQKPTYTRDSLTKGDQVQGRIIAVSTLFHAITALRDTDKPLNRSR